VIAQGEIVARADANYFDSMRAFAAQIDTGEVRERAGLLIVATGLPVAMLNIAFVTRPLADAATLLREATVYFDGRGLPFLVRVRESVHEESERAAQALGLEYRDSIPGMVLYPIPDAPPERSWLEVRRVNDMPSLVQYAGVLAGGFGMPPELGRAFASPGMLSLPDVSLYTGFVDGEPVATSALFMSSHVAGVYNVATLDAYRRRGLGAAMTWHAVLDGAAAGCAMASLQASEMGKPVYEGMGFRVVTGYKTYARPEGL
jgi:ribosomal protein S18 acetylase RimI-like enzyme